MIDDPGLDKFLSDFKVKGKKGKKRGRWPDGAVSKSLKKRTELASDAPHEHLDAIVQDQGVEPTVEAIKAWDQRVNGAPIIDVAHSLGVSIELAKKLIAEVHSAIHEDLKATLEQNRTIDLARIDQLLLAYLPAAKAGDDKAAAIVLKALAHRARLTGSEPSPEPIKSTHIDNVQAWIVQALPGINRLVDDLPKE